MTNETKSDTSDLAHRRQEQILAAARHIFATHGFRRTKIDQIAEHLNIGKGTIYRYFSDKKALFLAVYEQGMSDLRSSFEQNVFPITDPPIRISTAIRTYFAFFDNNRELIEIMMQVRSEFKDEFKRIHMLMYKDYIVRIQNTLRNGIEMGLFHDLDIERTADTISATLHGVLQSFYMREFQPPEMLADRAETVVSLILEGVLKRD